MTTTHHNELRGRRASGAKSAGLALAMLGALASTHGASAQTSYTITDLGVPPTGNSSEATGLNSAGTVVGNSNLSVGARGFVSSAGGLQPLATLEGGTFSNAAAINNSGIVVGGSSNNTNYQKGVACKWSSPGNPQILGTLTGDDSSFASGINNAGTVVGNSSGSHSLAVIWNGGAAQLIGSLPNDQVSGAYDINNNNVVVGGTLRLNAQNQIILRRAFRWSGSIQELPELPGTTLHETQANAINDAGVAVGYSGRFATRWDSAGAPQSLGTLPGYYGSQAYDINTSGVIVGTSDGSAVRWSSAGAIVDLNTLIPANSDWKLARAISINDKGQIAAVGRHLSEFEDHALLLTPATPNVRPQNLKLEAIGLTAGGTVSDPVNKARLFRATYRDLNGYRDVRYAYLQIKTGSSNVLRFAYDLPNNKLYILGDDGKYKGGVRPGTSGVLSNSLGTISFKATVARVVDANTFQIDWTIAAKAPLAGATHPVLLYVSDKGGLSDGFDRGANWQITSAP